MKVVKQIRLILGVSQSEMAKYLGINPPNYCNIENGILVPKNIGDIKRKASIYLLPLLHKHIDVIDSELQNCKLLAKELQTNLKHENNYHHTGSTGTAPILSVSDLDPNQPI